MKKAKLRWQSFTSNSYCRSVDGDHSPESGDEMDRVEVYLRLKPVSPGEIDISEIQNSKAVIIDPQLSGQRFVLYRLPRLRFAEPLICITMIREEIVHRSNQCLQALVEPEGGSLHFRTYFRASVQPTRSLSASGFALCA